MGSNKKKMQMFSFHKHIVVVHVKGYTLTYSWPSFSLPSQTNRVSSTDLCWPIDSSAFRQESARMKCSDFTFLFFYLWTRRTIYDYIIILCFLIYFRRFVLFYFPFSFNMWVRMKWFTKMNHFQFSVPAFTQRIWTCITTSLDHELKTRNPLSVW